MQIKFIGVSFSILCINICAVSYGQEVIVPFGFAHNDYKHEHPLKDALHNGYTYIEADVFLFHKELIVTHGLPFFKRHRTLESLYLKPLSDCISKNGNVFSNYSSPLVLMIDIKSSANPTYRAIKTLLEKYSSILSCSQDGQFTPGKITILLSGHRPYSLIKSESRHLVFLDGKMNSSNTDTSWDGLFQMVSRKYSRVMKWQGKGEMPQDQRQRLIQMIDSAHIHKKKVRLWASPENPIVWGELLKCGVDLISTDRLTTLKSYFIDSVIERSK